jgi:hypothetical protein
VNSFSQPSVHDNSRHLSITIELPKLVLFEMLGEFLSLTQNRDLTATLAPSASSHMIMDPKGSDSQDSSSTSSLVSGIGRKRKTMTAKAPECTTQVRRSPKCNKYNGFKPRNYSDTKAVQSKVKPSKNPTIKSVQDEAGPSTTILGETYVPTIQAIVVNLYGVPPGDVSPKKLLISLFRRLCLNLSVSVLYCLYCNELP